MLASILLYAILTWTLPSNAKSNPLTFYVVMIMAVWCLSVIFFWQRKFLVPAELVLATQPVDAKALARWRVGYLVVYSGCESIALWGVVLHFFGFNVFRVTPFYAAGFILLLFFAPRRTSNAIG